MYRLAVVCAKLQDPKFSCITSEVWVRPWVLFFPQSEGLGRNQTEPTLSAGFPFCTGRAWAGQIAFVLA